jgi:Domain of unknown function (DUF4194)
MNTQTLEFSDISFVLVELLRDPIYREDAEMWETLRTQQEKVRHYFHQIGQELVMDEAEGYAFLRQLECDGVDRIPKLAQRRPLNYHTTLLLVCLREEFCRFDTTAPDATRLVKTRGELQNLVIAFLPETSNQVRDLGKVDTAIQRCVELGFLKLINSDTEEFEVKRIVKAKLGPNELEAIKKRLTDYATSNTNGD